MSRGTDGCGSSRGRLDAGSVRPSIRLDEQPLSRSRDPCFPEPRSMLVLYYFIIKVVFFYSLVHSFIKYETLQKHWLFLSILYTAGVGFLYWVFFMAPADAPNWREWGIWLAKTFVLIAVYFRLLA